MARSKFSKIAVSGAIAAGIVSSLFGAGAASADSNFDMTKGGKFEAPMVNEFPTNTRYWGRVMCEKQFDNGNHLARKNGHSGSLYGAHCG